MLTGRINTIKSKENKHIALVVFAFFLQIVFFSNIRAEDASIPIQGVVSVGVVNVSFLMENAPQSELASTQLKSKFSPQEKKLAEELTDINALELELNEIKVTKKSLELQRKKERQLRSRKRLRSRSLQDFREELRFARDAALDDVQKEVFKAIDEVRVKKKIDIVLQDYISASERVDITQAVLEHLKSKIDNPKASNSETK